MSSWLKYSTYVWSFRSHLDTALPLPSRSMEGGGCAFPEEHIDLKSFPEPSAGAAVSMWTAISCDYHFRSLFAERSASRLTLWQPGEFCSPTSSDLAHRPDIQSFLFHLPLPSHSRDTPVMDTLNPVHSSLRLPSSSISDSLDVIALNRILTLSGIVNLNTSTMRSGWISSS